jgi:hypothetical protein
MFYATQKMLHAISFLVACDMCSCIKQVAKNSFYSTMHMKKILPFFQKPKKKSQKIDNYF